MAAEPLEVVVVGGGVSGLAAALALRREGEALSRRGGRVLRVTVCESAPQVGGKLTVADVGGLPVDQGAEALLARRHEGIDLVREVGMGGQLVPAATSEAGVWARGRIRRLPTRQVMGVPADLRALAGSGVVSARGLLRAAGDLVAPRRWPGPGAADEDADVSVGAYVTARLGREVVERLVDPLLGGVYAGGADHLSLQATMPALAAAAARRRSLLGAARSVRAGATPGGPVFMGLRGGLGSLPAALARASGARVRTAMPVRALERKGSRWQVTCGPASAPVRLLADAVVLALPALPAARLLAEVVPSASRELAAVDYASVATVTLVFDRRHVNVRLPGSGFLVPHVEGRRVKAVTFLSSKWGWLAEEAPGTTVLRCSIGRHGHEADLQVDDEDLVAAVLDDLAALLGLAARPLASQVTRWGGALPQYAVGHHQRMARVLDAVGRVPGLAVCGAAYGGIGVPACIASAEAAAAQASASLSVAPS